MQNMKMNQTHCLPSNWGQSEGRFRLEEEREKRLLEKPQEVDEACYSLEEGSPDFEETLPVNGSRNNWDYRRADSGRDRSLPSEECNSETAVVLPTKNKYGVIKNVNPPHTFDPSQTFRPTDSDSSEALIPRGLQEFHPSEDQIIPDFDHLLSEEAEKAEDSSEYVKRICQQMVQDGRSSNQIYDELNTSSFGGKLYDLGAEDSSVDVSTDGSEGDLSWSEDVCETLVESMRMSSQCEDDSCKEKNCLLGRQLIANIESDLVNLRMTMSMSTRRLLSAIIDHSDGCDDTSCSVPWCSFFTQYRDEHSNVEEKRAYLQRWYRRMQLTQDFEELDVEIPETAEFVQLDPDVLWPCVEHSRMRKEELPYCQRTQLLPLPAAAVREEVRIIPRNGIDFLVNGHFGRYGQLELTALSTTIQPGTMLLNITQYVSSENSKDLWTSLVGLRHENFVRHLWVCIDGNNVTICRDHSCMDSESLASLVKKVRPPHRIDNDDVIRYVTGLVSATMFLNDNKIFYLKWIASGIQLNYDYTSARLSDFSSAVNSSVIEEDEEMVDMVVNSLPPYILPPEIFRREESFGRIGAFTEVWGVGCIIYHMCCRHPVHNDVRHEPSETLLQKVEEFAPKDHLKSVNCPAMLQILSRIFTYEADRISLPALEKLLKESTRTNNR